MSQPAPQGVNDAEFQDIQKPGNINLTEEQPTTSSLTNTSSIPSFANVSDLFHLATGLLLPYVFHPLKAIEIYLPGVASMWPFNISTSFKPEKDISDLTNKVVLVTGGNAGLGKETVLQFAKHNPRKIFLAARTESKARDAIASVKANIPQEIEIEYLPLDLTSLPSIQKAAEQVTSRTDRLDILILNAGIMAVPPGKTPSGQEIQLGTNHVGHFLLTKLLLPTLEKTATQHNSDVRILSLSSEAWHMSPNLDTVLSTEKLHAQGPWARYGASKAANIMFAAELARRYPALTSVSLHPGMIKTELYAPNSEVNPILKYGSQVIGPLFFQSIAAGALNSLWLAAGAHKEELKNGAYYTPVGKLQSNAWASNADAGRKLWEWTEQELKNAGY
jgi:NAD(P)-dependent dehydrogenase (short-subunit alcohol dehydrogenase family)